MYIIGLDVGTSSVKAALLSCDGNVQTCRAMYPEGLRVSPEGWVAAISDAVKEITYFVDKTLVEGIGLTTQVGTYLLYREDATNLPVYGWNEGGAESQLEDLLYERDREFYIENISMFHPKLISYPAPRIRWFQEERSRQWAACEKLLAPKDYLYKVLTGCVCSDIYTWNGLVKLPEGIITEDVLELLNIKRDKLPEIYDAFDAPGSLCHASAALLDLPEGIPVYLGCNDSHSSLAGMGITSVGQNFDITGTSEHVGMITSDIIGDEDVICAPFFSGHMTFGVNQSAGSSIDWGFETFGYDEKAIFSIYEKTQANECKPPIFLPYLCGERAPIWDSNAKGVFFGLSDTTTRQEMMYSVLEGVVFSVKHMWSMLPTGSEENRTMRIGGGAASNDFLNRIKADILGYTLERPSEKQSGALGAALIGAVGAKWYENLTAGANNIVSVETTVEPHIINGNLLRRFDVYRSLYPKLRSVFQVW